MGSSWLLKAADLPLNPWHTERHIKEYHEEIKNPTAPGLMNHFTFMFQCESLHGLTPSSFRNLKDNTVIFEDLTIKIYTKKDTRWYFKSFRVLRVLQNMDLFTTSVLNMKKLDCFGHKYVYLWFFRLPRCVLISE